MFHNQNAGKNHNIKIAKKSFENIVGYKYLVMTTAHQNYSHEEIKSRLSSVNT
jgi:hypothetical protein